MSRNRSIFRAARHDRGTALTIPAGAPFAAWLVEGVLARYGEAMADPLALTLFLPTRRSIATVQEAFLRARGRATSLLPTLIPLGEVDEDDLDAVGLPQMAGETAAGRKSPVSGRYAADVLARLVQQFMTGQARSPTMKAISPPPGHPARRRAWLPG